MVAIKNILFFITAASALTLRRRDAATITTDVNTLDSKVQALTTAVTNFNGNYFAAINVANAESAVEAALKQGTSDAQASSTLSSADSSSIISLINSSLGPDVQKSLQALVNQKSAFDSAGLTSTVQSDLSTLKNETDAFGAALLAITSSDQINNANAAQANIDSYFATAIAAYDD